MLTFYTSNSSTAGRSPNARLVWCCCCCCRHACCCRWSSHTVRPTAAPRRREPAPNRL